MASRFFDSDVIYGVAVADPRFEKFVGEVMATTRLNLMEVYYVLRRAGHAGRAVEVYRETLPHAIEFSDEDLIAAMDWRSENFRKKTRELSYIDAVGYWVARSNGLIFTTGDRKFSGYPGVAVV